MRAVLVVSRRRVLPIELRRQGFEVVDVREVDHLPGVLDASVSAVVVDAPESEVAQQVLDVVAEAVAPPPVVVLGGCPEETERSGLRVTHLEVPVSTPEVAAVLRALVAAPGSSPEAAPAPVPLPAPETADDADPVQDHTGREPAPLSAEPRDTPGGRWRRRAGRESRRLVPVVAADTDEQTWQAATDVVLAALPFLSPVDEVVVSLLDAAVQDAEAQAGCVLLEEDGVWEVAAELGLRLGERRLALRRGDWLVERLTAHPVLVRVDDTDDARAALAGVPLASWRSVVAFPVARGGALVVLARDTTRFGADVVRSLPAVASLFDPLVRDAQLALRLRRALDSVC